MTKLPTIALISVIALLMTIYSCGKDNKSAPYQVFDADNNAYDTVHIGKQIWLKQNLNVTHFRDNTAIPEVEDGATWANVLNTNSPAWCNYSSNKLNGATYGKLYNWYVITAVNELCPTNYHVPTDTDWHALAKYLDNTALYAPDESEIGGGKLKAVTLWSPNTGATNSSGFTGLPGGSRSDNGTFSGLTSAGYFWTSTECFDSGGAWVRGINDTTVILMRGNANALNGFSVRCVHD